MRIEDEDVTTNKQFDNEDMHVGVDPKSGRLFRRRIDWDVRGILAILSLLGAFALAFTQLIVSPEHSAEIPAWAAAIVAGVTGFYFGSRGGGM